MVTPAIDARAPDAIRLGIGPPGPVYEVCVASSSALQAHVNGLRCGTASLGACKLRVGRMHYRIVLLAP
jgi:hypothetical protein